MWARGACSLLEGGQTAPPLWTVVWWCPYSPAVAPCGIWSQAGSVTSAEKATGRWLGPLAPNGGSVSASLPALPLDGHRLSSAPAW